MFEFFKKRKKKKTAEPTETLLHKELNFAATEAYKLLRINLLFSLPDNGKCRVVGVTSSVRGEGKSTTSINLSYALSMLGKRVLLLEGDLRLPSISTKLGIESEPGLSDTLIRLGDKLDDIRTMPENENWHVLTAGSIPPNPAEMLGSPKMAELLEELAPKYDFIIVDLPPVNIVSDALILSSHLDGMIVVVRQNYSRRREVTRCIKQLELAEAKLLGFVMSAVKEGRGSYKKKSGYGYGYGGYEGYGDPSKRATVVSQPAKSEEADAIRQEESDVASEPAGGAEGEMIGESLEKPSTNQSDDGQPKSMSDGGLK